MADAVRELTYSQAIQEALGMAMERDERVFLMGEDIGVYAGEIARAPWTRGTPPDPGAA